jgi:tetratricopeptide (TPR) repeat protein
MIGRGSRAALLAGLLMAVLACQVPAIRPKANNPTPAPSPSGAARLEAADATLYKGDYDGAEASYRALIKDEVPGAAAHYSTLLAYEGRLQEAVAQAKSGVRARADSDSLGRLARALDWSEDVAGALAAGARGVQARPVAPLAHTFYSEALADSGRYSEAERELRAAERVVTDGYLRAELDREWANLYRNRGELQSELNYIQLAIKDQPNFPERQLELVRYDYANQKPAAAQAVLDKLRTGPNGRNYWALVSGAGAAFIGGDATHADSLFTAAAGVRPGGAEAVLGRAELAVALKREFNAAHDLLAEALKKDPGSDQVYRYLRYLDLLVLKKDPDADLQALVPRPPADPTPELRRAALDTVNGYRAAVGLPPVAEDPALSQGAEAHAYYYLFNLGQPQLQGLGIHSEDESLPGFTGASSVLRDRHFGYAGTRGAEVIDHVATPEGSVRVWMDSVYHRYPLLAREIAAAGFATVSLGIVSISILDLGVSDPGRGDSTVYPTPDQADVQPQFNGHEVPDPVPPGATYPVGYPVTLQLGAAQTLSVTSGRLIDADGHEVASYTIAPAASGLTPWEWALFSRQPLKMGSRYTVEVVGKVDGQDFTKRWSFTVASQ